MFNGEGLGASRDNFSTNLARLKNLRRCFVRVHLERDAVLAQVQASAEDSAADTDTAKVGECPLDALNEEPTWTGGIDLHWLAQEQCEWLRNEHQTTLEMMFIYLISMLDVFFGQWGPEHQLWPGNNWPAATAENFRRAGPTIRPVAEQQLVEYRARRNVLVHRGGIADTEYCDCVRDRAYLGRRLRVDESYLDTTTDFVDHLVAATAVRAQGVKFTVKHEDTSDWYSSRRIGNKYSSYKVLIDEETNRILGAHVFGPHADDVINLFALAMCTGAKASDVRSALYAYPSVSGDVSYMV